MRWKITIEGVGDQMRANHLAWEFVQKLEESGQAVEESCISCGETDVLKFPIRPCTAPVGGKILTFPTETNELKPTPPPQVLKVQGIESAFKTGFDK